MTYFDETWHTRVSSLNTGQVRIWPHSVHIWPRYSRFSASLNFPLYLYTTLTCHIYKVKQHILWSVLGWVPQLGIPIDSGLIFFFFFLSLAFIDRWTTCLRVILIKQPTFILQECLLSCLRALNSHFNMI